MSLWWDRVGSLFWTLLVLALLGAGVAGLYNVYRDDLDVVRLAEAAACEGEGKACPLQLQRVFVERGPFSETFEWVTPKWEQVRVRCARREILIGEYACEVRDRRPAPQGVQAAPNAPRPTKGPVKVRAPAAAASSAAAPAAPPGSASPSPTPSGEAR